MAPAAETATTRDREIEEWASRIAGWRKKVEVFAYFNNDWNGYAVRNGLALKKALKLR